MGPERLSVPSQETHSHTDKLFLFPTAGAQHLAQPVRATLRVRLDQHPPGLYSGEKGSPTPITLLCSMLLPHPTYTHS